MPKKTLKRFLPDPDTLKSHPSLKIFGERLYHANLWRLNRLSVIRAVTIGLFICCLPLPGHMLMAALLSIFWRANLPIAIATTWVSNPFTMGPMYYIGYKIGITLLHLPEQHLPQHISFHWMLTELEFIARPLFLGSVIFGLILAFLGNIIIRILWRTLAVLHLRRRAKRKAAR